MDELVHHCLRQLAFDGDLGCDVLRLHDFINEFYAKASSSLKQNVDDAFCAFVWSLVAQQPDVRVGTVPPGSTEVYIAPQASAKRKSKAKGEEPEENLRPKGLHVIPDAALRSLEELCAQYQDGLRIAVDEETSFEALTGSHVRPSKLTPMVYTTLQLIARGRENGLTVVELGKKTGYDQKTCFYVVKQLQDLNLIEKRRRPGISTNICIHRYFFDNSPIWQNIVAEETMVESDDEEDEAHLEDGSSTVAVSFTPIESRHLTSFPLIRARLVKLLKNSPHQMHAYRNLLKRIGFENPVKKDRKFFGIHLRDLVEQGIAEKVQVPHLDKARYPVKKVICLRLLTEGIASDDAENLDIDSAHTELKLHLTIHKQIITLLEQANTRGMTLSELSSALCDFDRRTVELLLAHLEKYPPPPHLIDLGIAQLGETHGREKRYKYYTIAHYRTIAEREKFDDPRYLDKDFSQVGDFLPMDANVFYNDQTYWARYVDNFKTGMGPETAGPPVKKKLGRPRKNLIEDGAAPSKKAQKGMKRKREEAENDPETSDLGNDEPAKPPPKKRGRPPKKRAISDATGAQIPEPAEGMMPDAEDGLAVDKLPPKRRGRPPKKRPPPPQTNGDVPLTTIASDELPAEASATSTVPKRRGRPPKVKQPVASSEHGDGSAAVEPTPKRRGRSSKVAVASENAVQDVLETMKPSMAIVTDEAWQDTAATPVGDIGAAVADRETVFQVPELRTIQAEAPIFQEDEQPLPAAQHISVAPSPPADRMPEQGVLLPTVAVTETTVSPSAVSGEVLSAGGAPDVQRTSTDLAGTLPDGEPGGVEQVTSLDTVLADGIPIDPQLLGQHHVSVPDSENTNSVDSTTESNTKRAQLESSVSSGPPPKRARTKDTQTSSGFRTKANISQSRRENEILRVIQNDGGISNTSIKEFCEAHAAIVEAITKEGGEASTKPGAMLDKRTVEYVLNGLESRGKVRLLTTSVRVPTGNTRRVRIVYLPEIPDEQVHTYLENLSAPIPGSAPAMKVLEEHVNFGGMSRRHRPRDRQPPTDDTPKVDPAVLQDPQQLQILFNQDDTAIRAALLADKNTLSQHYGYISGKALRARELHLASIELLTASQSLLHSEFVLSSEHGVLHFDHYFEEIPVALYCSLVMTLVEDEHLTEMLRHPESRLTPVVKLPEALRQKLDIGRSRSRARILDLLEMLRGLGVVQPLQSCEPDDASVIFRDGERAFKPCTHHSWKTFEAPQLWQFSFSAPLHAWCLSEPSPPYWKHMPTSAVTECSDYWDVLYRVCFDKNYVESLGLSTSSDSLPDTAAVLAVKRCFCRQTSWRRHTLSDAQTGYLSLFLDKGIGNTPLQDADGGAARIHHIAWVISSSSELVSDFYQRAYTKHAHELRKAQRRHEQAAETRERDERARATIAQRAADAKRQKEQEWDEMVQKVHPEPLKGTALARVRRLRSLFLQTPRTDRQKWEKSISEAINEATIAAKKLLPAARHTVVTPIARTPAVPPPQVVPSGPEKPIEELIEQQSALPMRNKEKKKKRKGGEEAAPEEPSRRYRFQWTKEFDELARDAVAIIKARCRDGTRLDFGALIQVFPGVPRNSVRQRALSLRDGSAAQAAYQARLEDRWYQLWMQHRGTNILPDDDPASPTNFDLVAHVKFLRKHVDKNAVRVGYVEQSSANKSVLPTSVEEVGATWEVVEKRAPGPTMDFMWTVAAEETREKFFTQQAFTAETGGIPQVVTHPSENMHVADAALKMVFGTPSENYDPDAGARLLRQLGEANVAAAQENLLQRGVLAKLVRDPTRSKPGRTLKISDINEGALGGPMPQETFQDAAALEDILYQEDAGEWRGWPLVATDGDTAALLELVSEGKIDFSVDTAHAQAARAKLDWNSKKADDDDIETVIQMRLVDGLGAEPPQPMEVQAQVAVLRNPESSDAGEVIIMHGQTADGSAASCILSSAGPINCAACLDEATSFFTRDLSENDRNIATELLAMLRERGAQGMPKSELTDKMRAHNLGLLSPIVRRVTEGPVPLAYWLGYKSIVLVSAAYLDAWTVAVQTPRNTTTRLLPRRWIDITGHRMAEVWEAAIRAVIGVILPRPGVSQGEIRWRLRSVYDRQEVNDVLEYLLDDGILERRILADVAFRAGAPDDAEERITAWCVVEGGEKHWYQV